MDEITDATFQAEVLESPVPVVVDFWAPWCKPCDAIEPHLRAIAEEHGERLRLVRLNIDENLATPGRYGVLALPTVILIADGAERTRVTGAHPKHRYDEAFAEHLP